MPSLLDPKFKYVPAAKQNLAKTFARIRKENAEAEKKAAAAALERIQKVRRIA